MDLRQWGEHQVLTRVHKNRWPETQAALVFSCLLSAEIVETVIYAATVWTGRRAQIILWLHLVTLVWLTDPQCSCFVASHWWSSSEINVFAKPKPSWFSRGYNSLSKRCVWVKSVTSTVKKCLSFSLMPHMYSDSQLRVVKDTCKMPRNLLKAALSMSGFLSILNEWNC